MHLAYFSAPSKALEMWLLDLGTVSLQESNTNFLTPFWYYPLVIRREVVVSSCSLTHLEPGSAGFSPQPGNWHSSVSSPGDREGTTKAHTMLSQTKAGSTWRRMFWSVSAVINSWFGRANWEQCSVCSVATPHLEWFKQKCPFLVWGVTLNVFHPCFGST